MIFNMTGGGGTNKLPSFVYTGEYQLLDDGKVGIQQNWRIKFLTSGRLTFNRAPGTLDVFLVGGGGNGGSVSGAGGGGGAGGKTLTTQFTPARGFVYDIVIGGAAGDTTAFGHTAQAGGSANGNTGGSGGSGGAGRGAKGGTDGSDGGCRESEDKYKGTGQGTTTREFGEAGATLYAGGGGGGAWGGSSTNFGEAGDETAGSGGVKTGGNGVTNRGGGGGGAETTPGTGGSGIVVIRNHREAKA